ncbi:MAG TPA: glycosyltransferase family 39 protein [Xanthobacteraceae bacterium]|jgi:4-amino-4-deoxy-L-arabinose transferase-like glycosyltransferase|nr:glycosyltransferase family 39 protein [Xanthobacteraceae bacterium]
MLCDPARRRPAVLGLVLLYAMIWTAYGIIAKSSQDINADMAEMVVWAHEPAFGYPKHPPLLAWIVRGWFMLFPQADWAYIVLAVFTIAAGIYLSFELAGEWIDGTKRAAVPFLLALIPFYNFLGLKFDQNSALIPLWALTILAFVRSLKTSHLGYAALAGIAAAAALLTKYWTVFLLLALAVSALACRRRYAYFRSAAPWVTALVAAAAVTPHVLWLVREDFPTLTWAVKRAAYSLSEGMEAAFKYGLGTVGYAIVAIGLVLALVRPSPAGLRDGFIPRDDRRIAAIVFWLPLAVPFVMAAILKISMIPLWNMPALALLPVMLLGSPLVKVSRDAVIGMAATAATITVGAALVSPAVAVAILWTGTENYAQYGRLLAREIEPEWRQTTAAPLDLLGGRYVLVATTAFYLRDRPSIYSDFSNYLSPWVDVGRIARSGIAMVCPADDEECLQELNARSAGRVGARRREVELTPHWFGISGAPARFVIATVPPAQ